MYKNYLYFLYSFIFRRFVKFILLTLLPLFCCSYVTHVNAAVPSGFSQESVLTNIHSPAYLNFSPDGRLFISERISGRLLIAKMDNNGSWSFNSQPFYTFDIPKNNNGQPEAVRSAGLRDIAFDPNFANNGYIYAFYMNNQTRHNRVVRIKASDSDPDIAQADSETLLLNLPFNGSSSSGSHNGGSLAFGSDNHLYISTGDGWSGGDSVQSLTTMTGKIFRITSSGSIPTDNPFYSETSGDYRAIYALGLRNPFTLASHPVSGTLYVNEARGTKKADIYIVEAAANYGHEGSSIGNSRSPWANASGAGGELITGGAWYPANGSFPNTYHDAYFTPLWGSNSSATGNISYIHSPSNTAVSSFATGIGNSDGGTATKPVDIGVGPDDNMYFLLTTYNTQYGSVERIAVSHQDTVSTPTISPNGGQYPNPVQVTLQTATANASIYYTLDGSDPTPSSSLYSTPFNINSSATLSARAYLNGHNPSQVTRSSFVIGSAGGNLPPVLVVPEDQIVTVGTQVFLDGSGSYDPDGDDLLLTGESWTQTAGTTVNIVNSNDEIAYFHATQAGIYEFELSMSDGIDTSTKRHIVTVMNELPPSLPHLELLLGFDDSNNIEVWDSSGQRNHFMQHGTSASTGIVNNALRFDGIADYISIADSDIQGNLPSSGATQFTISAWLKLSSLNRRHPIVLKQGSGTRGFLLSVEDNNKLTLELFKNQNNKSLLSAPSALSRDTWYHIAASYKFVADGSSQARLYLDGNLVASANNFVGPLQNNSVEMSVGRYYWNSSYKRFMHGDIDQLYIYSSQLSNAEVQQLYNAHSAVPETACADGIDNDNDGLIDYPQDPGCGSASDNDETDPPASQCADGVDNDADGLIDYPNDPGCSSASDNDETDPQQQEPTPQHYYPFSDSGNDAAGTNHAVIHGASFATGMQGSALLFDGNNDYASLGDLDIAGDQLTIAAWIKPNDISNCGNYEDCRIISKATGTAEQDHEVMLSTIRSGGKFRFRLKTDGVTSTLIASNANGTVTNGTWTHVAATYDGQQMRVYINGVQVGSTGKTGTMSLSANVGVRIGDNPGSTRKYWDGLIDELRIYNQALDQSAIQNLTQVQN